MNNPQKILILLLILVAALLASQYLASLQIQTITGEVSQREKLANVRHAKLLSWLLPKRASQISYQITPKTRYYELIFKINEEDFRQWIENVQGGEVEIYQTPADGDSIVSSRFQMVEIPTPDGIDFHLNSLGDGGVHIAQGYWLPHSTTSKFHQFSAAFDSQRKLAYVYFYR